MNGDGDLTFKDGGRYSGSFINNKKDGFGIM